MIFHNQQRQEPVQTVAPQIEIKPQLWQQEKPISEAQTAQMPEQKQAYALINYLLGKKSQQGKEEFQALLQSDIAAQQKIEESEVQYLVADRIKQDKVQTCQKQLTLQKELA